jgi:hypothetical protein
VRSCVMRVRVCVFVVLLPLTLPYTVTRVFPKFSLSSSYASI